MIWPASFLSIFLALSICTSLVVDPPEVRFPSAEGKALTGDKFLVPEDFAKPYNLLLLAFQREQQEDVDTWIPRLEKVEDANDNFGFYEFPVLPEMNSMVRWFIYQGMRSGITSDRGRARTITFHLNKEEFREKLRIETEELIQVFLADSTGVIIWRESGTWSEDKERELLRILSRVDGAEGDS
jgi:hypothetical protein